MLSVEMFFRLMTAPIILCVVSNTNDGKNAPCQLNEFLINSKARYRECQFARKWSEDWTVDITGIFLINNAGMMAWFKSLGDAPAKWRRRSWADRRLLMEAFLLLGVARLSILALPFKWLSVTLGRRMKETGAQINASDFRCALRIGQAVRSAANNTPWESVCLSQAVAAQWMLKRRHIAGTLYLGVTKDEAKPEKLIAHAWLRYGSVILTGREGHRKFTVVASFS